jgi:hypothetical protein
MKSRTTPPDQYEFVVPWQLPSEPKIKVVIDLTDPASAAPTKLVDPSAKTKSSDRLTSGLSI